MGQKPTNEEHRDLSVLPRTLGKDFSFFRKYYFPEHSKIEDAAFHKEVSGILQGMIGNRGAKLALAAPRGIAKSTLVTLEYIIYCIVYRFESYIVIASSTSDQAETFLLHVKTELTQNARLLRDFSGVCETGKKPGPPRWKQNEIITRNDVKVNALGCGQQIRGRRHKQYRPSLIVLDDIEGGDEAQTGEGYDKLHDWLTKSVLKSGNGDTNTIFLGTIHHYNSLLAQFTDPKSNTGWIKKVYRAIISWAANQELWERWKNIHNYLVAYNGKDGPQAADEFFNDNKEAMLAGAEVLWPQQKSYYELMKQREDEGALSFDSEMQNEPINPKECLFNINEMHYWDDAFRSEEELFNAIPNRLIYGACDPSLGKRNKHGDFTAIISALKDLDKGIIYVLDADIERRFPDQTIDTILEYHKRREYQQFAFETNQFQEYMASELQKRSTERQVYLPLKEIEHSTDKRARIETTQPLVKNGTIRFCHRHYRLLEQMKYYPKGAHDDGLDALEMMVNLCKNGMTIFDVPLERYKELNNMFAQMAYAKRFNGGYW